MVDFEADGNPELLMLHTRDKESHLKARYERGEELFAVSVYRTGSNGVDHLYFSTPQLGDREKFSLAGYGDRIVMGIYRIVSLVGGDRVSESYSGSIAEKDGVNPEWSGKDKDWGWLDGISWNPFTIYDGSGIRYSASPP